MIQLVFAEVRVSPLAEVPVLVLTETGGKRRLPIWITATAGAAILAATEPEDEDHPDTHRLLLDVLASRGMGIDAVHILGADAGVYTARLIVSGLPVICRPSDAVALALRGGVPILTTEEVLRDHAVDPQRAAPPPGHELDEVEQFRAFLQDVRAEDFDEPQA